MTSQEAFNKVWEHFVVNGGEQSTGDREDAPRCLYRANLRRNSKKRCAAGVLIPDEVYEAKLESCGGWSGVVCCAKSGDFKPPLTAVVLDIGHDDVVSDMQTAHDTYKKHSVEEWSTYIKRQLERIAIEHGLKVPA